MAKERVVFAFAPNPQTGQTTFTVEIGPRGAQRGTKQSSPDTRRASGSQAEIGQPSKVHDGTVVDKPRQTSAYGTLPDKTNELGQPAHPLEGNPLEGNPLEEIHDSWSSTSSDCSSPMGSEDGDGIFTGSKAPRVYHVSPAFNRPSLLSIV